MSARKRRRLIIPVLLLVGVVDFIQRQTVPTKDHRAKSFMPPGRIARDSVSQVPSLRRTILLKAEHGFDFIQSIRDGAQMNDTMAISAKNGEVFHARLCGILNFGQWQ